MLCVLFRHGIAAPPQEWEGPDASRPLTKDGIEKTRKAAEGLTRLDIIPTHILASPYTRAQETAALVKESYAIPSEIQTCPDLVPHAPPEKILKTLGSLPADATVLCVGHEPHLGSTAGMMIFGKPVMGLSLKKAGACCVEFSGSPKPGQGILEWWLPPAYLRQFRKT